MDVLAALSVVVFVLSLILGGPPKFLPPWTAAFFVSVIFLARVSIHERREGRNPMESHPDAVLFWACLTLYLGSFRWHGGDDIPNSMLPYQIWRHGSLAFDELRTWATVPGMIDMVQEHSGRLLSNFPVAPGVIAAPLYAIPALFGPAPNDVLLHSLAKISGALITAASVVVLRRAAVRRASASWAFQCAALYGFASYAFSVSSQALYSHGPAQLGVALGLLGLLSEGSGMSTLAGFGFSLAWASRDDSLLFAAAAVVYLLVHRRERLVAFAVGAILPVALNLSYWQYYTGALRPPYFEMQTRMFAWPDLGSATAMMLSPTRGMLFFFPAAIFGAWGAWKAARTDSGRWAFYFFAACVATWIAFATRTSWTGGNTYGDRYFSVVCMVLALCCAEIEAEILATSTRRAAWCAIFSYGVLVHAFGAYFHWPGNFATLREQEAAVWSLRLFSPVYTFLEGGPIGATPMPWRAIGAAGLIGLFFLPAWLWSRRTIRS